MLLHEFTCVSEIISEIKNGRPFVLVDSENRENEGDLVFPAELIDSEIVNFMMSKCRGMICLCITEDRAKKLNIGLIPKINCANNHNMANFAWPIESASNIGTGISAADRAHTIRVASAMNACASDISVPGHVSTIIGKKNGLMERLGHTEGSMTFMKLAEFRPFSVICEIVNDDGRMAKLPDLIKFSAMYDVKITAVEVLLQYIKDIGVNCTL